MHDSKAVALRGNWRWRWLREVHQSCPGGGQQIIRAFGAALIDKLLKCSGVVAGSGKLIDLPLPGCFERCLLLLLSSQGGGLR
ncbi:hypothetical protein NKH82_25410, partial [Mesorhizobium sp. M0915]|uniref:hypothetical protein n=1 Tax=Mesorhizobium sp. M0915 TaxID=2957027 RepID=UPI00333B9845